MGDAIIDVRDLTVKSGQRYLLNSISWSVHPGEQWVVFGANGSGKTTLLSAVAGFRRYSSGSIALFGEQLRAENILSMRKRVGLVSSSFFDTYYHNESVMDIILAGMTGSLGRDFFLSDGETHQALTWLERFGLVDKRDMPFDSLSKGQRQTVLLIRALMNDPDVLILDEPCSGLDIDARERVLALVSHIAATTSTTVVYVTHYTEELLDVFTHALLLKRGRTFKMGAMAECFTDEAMSGLLEHPVRIGASENGRLHVRFEQSSEGGWLQ